MKLKTQQSHRIEPQIYKLLVRIINHMDLNKPAYDLSNDELIEGIIDQIKEIGDDLNTPIFRVGKQFFIYCDEEPLPIPNKAFEKFLMIVCDHLCIDKEVMTYIPFRNQLFGRAWRELKPDE